MTVLERFRDKKKKIEYSLEDQQPCVQILLLKSLQKDRKKLKISKVVVRKDHDLGISPK